MGDDARNDDGIYEAKDVITDGIYATLEILKQLKRGDILTWQEMEAATGFLQYGTHWTAYLKRLRRDFLNESGIVLWPVKGVGVRLLTIEEQIHMRSIARQRRAARQLSRDVKELRAIPDTELTDHQREARRRKIDRSKISKQSVLYSLRIGHQLARAPETTPRLKPQPKAVVE